MGLKVLPPTLRKNNRYLTVEIKTEFPIAKEDLVSIVWDACVRFQGELNTSKFNLWVMRFYEQESGGSHYFYNAIVRCQRDCVGQVRSSLAMANMYRKGRISLTTIGLSGTIKASHRYI